MMVMLAASNGIGPLELSPLIILVILGTSIWVFIDATSRLGVGSGVMWGLGCLALWIVFFPFYLVERARDLRTRSAVPPSRLPPAQWLRDPQGHAPYRYWDGQRWTEHTTDSP